MRDEKGISGAHHRRYGSQPISVPFLWEHKPGLPKRDWIAKPVSLVAADISAAKAKPASLDETAIMPLQLVISVPFQWEEKPGKPLLLIDENPASAVLSSWNPLMRGEERDFDTFALDMHSSSFESDQDYLPSDSQATFREGSGKADSIKDESWYSVSEENSHCNSSRSAMQIGGVENPYLDFLYQMPTPPVFAAREEKSCTADSSGLVKRTLTLGELMLLSRKLSCGGNPVYVRKRRLFSMENIRKGLLACSLQNKWPKKQCIPHQKVGLTSQIAMWAVSEFFQMNNTL